MSAEVELYAPPPTSIQHWLNESNAAHQFAELVTKTELCPEPYKGKPAEATVAMIKGAEIGLTPLESLSAINVIKGTAALSAIALRALAQSRGHEIWIEKATAKECVAKGRRNGSDVIQESRWTIDRANALGITNKDNWRKQPQAMLTARATSEICRLVAADALLGIGYSVEELADETDAEVTPIRRRARRTTTSTPKAVRSGDAPAAKGPVVDEPPLDDDPEEIQAEPITPAQSKMLHALYGDIGWTDRNDKLRAASLIVGRPLESSNDLTKTEASRLIDELNSIVTADDPSDALTGVLEALTQDADIVDAEVVEAS